MPARPVERRVRPQGSFMGERVGNFVVHDASIIVNHHRLHGRRNDSSLDINSGECFDGAQRVPKRNDLKFGSSAQLAAQYGCTNEARNRSKLRECFVSKVIDVAISKFGLGDSLPVSRYHDAGSDKSFIM